MSTQEERWLLMEKYRGVRTTEFEYDKRRLVQGEPLAYVIGSTPFLNLNIDVSYRPHTPRVETEFWTEKVIEIIRKDVRAHVRCLDMFAGSGCIGLSIAHSIPNAYVDLADSDMRCINQIEKNIKLNAIEKKKAHVVHSDLFSNVPGRYDYIVANPPYIALGNLARVEDSVLHFEPHQALFGGVDGLDVIRRFLAEAPLHLEKNAKIFMEFDYTQKESIQELLTELHYVGIDFGRDQYGRWRFVCVCTDRAVEGAACGI